MQVGRVFINGSVQNSTIITGNNTSRKLGWVKNPFNDSLVCFVGDKKAQIIFGQPKGNYNFIISEEKNGVTKQLVNGICTDLDKVKLMIEGYFYGLV